MRLARRILPLLLCVAYLPAAALPCPTPGLERRLQPTAGIAPTASAASEPAGRAPEGGGNMDPGAHAHHAHAGAHDVAPRALAGGDHAHHAHPHGPPHAQAPRAQATTPRADEPGLQTAASAETARFQLPCPCGCDERASHPATGGRLGPVLISLAATEPAIPTRPLHPAVEPHPHPEPIRSLDPIPI
jgi:hypothetical protein